LFTHDITISYAGKSHLKTGPHMSLAFTLPFSPDRVYSYVIALYKNPNNYFIYFLCLALYRPCHLLHYYSSHIASVLALTYELSMEVHFFLQLCIVLTKFGIPS